MKTFLKAFWVVIIGILIFAGWIWGLPVVLKTWGPYDVTTGGITGPKPAPIQNNDVSYLVVTSTRVNIVNGSLTSTVMIGNPGIGITCQWNGTNYTLTRYPANSTTPTITTSTSC